MIVGCLQVHHGAQAMTRREAGAGQMVVVRPGVAHKFVNAGTGRLRQIDLHASPRFITEWLE
jgi:mannose-6-phosphate isomerase-like protein (cupin superfamily)